METRAPAGATDQNPTGEETRSVLVHEGSFARVYRVSAVQHRNRDTSSSSDGRAGAVAVKVPAGEPPSREQQQRLRDEYIICAGAELNGCAATRRALRCVTADDGLPRAIHLEWARGITLMEWTRRNGVDTKLNPSSCRSDADSDAPRRLILCKMVRLAWAVAGAFAEIHEAGVVHNNITTDNIIVDVHPAVALGKHENNRRGNRAEREVDEFSIKVVGLGVAILWHDRESPAFVHAKQRDLAALGVALGRVFLGLSGCFASHGDTGSDDELCREEFARATSNDQNESGQSWAGVPVIVLTLIAKLTSGGKETTEPDCFYRCARDVQLDLSQMLDYPERLLFETNESEGTTGVLDFPCHRLYGRQTEMATVFDAYSRVADAACTGRSEMVLVSGPSGSGKSGLVRHFRQVLNNERDADNFVCGKFDSLRHAEPLSAIRAAFTDYFDKLFERSRCGDLYFVGSAIREKVGPDGISALVDLIPSLPRTMGKEPSIDGEAANVCGQGAQNRLRYLFLSVVEAVASQSRPLVFFLDELQWADAASLGIIEALVTNSSCAFLVFVGCYRDDEVGYTHPFSVRMREIEKQGIPITNVKVGGISRDSMNHMISDAMHALRTSTKSLTDAVYFQSGGNTLCAIQFITSLRNEDLLTQSPSGSWQWNVKTIESRNAQDALQLISDKIRSLPVEVSGALQVAACLGSRCEEATLHLISDENNSTKTERDWRGDGVVRGNAHKNLDVMINIAAYQGLMNKVHSRYEFVHDLVQHAVYSLIPESTKRPLHLEIGKRIWKGSTSARLEEENIFLAIDQIYLGLMCVDPGEKIDIATFFVRAGRKAMSLALFPSAATYFEAGIELLGTGHWDDHYSLSLALYESFAETENCNGHFEGMREIVDEIFACARCFDDKLAAYSTLVKALGAMGMIQKAIEIGLLVLEELGEVFPESNEASFHFLGEIGAIRNLLDEYSDETLVTAMNEMEDGRKITVMKFLNHMALYTSVGNKVDLNVLIVLRMTQVTLRHGACKESAFAFACYGTILCQMGQSKRGYKFGQFALELLERFKSQLFLPGVYACVYTKLRFWGEHLKLCLQPLLRGYQIGIHFGEVQLALINARMFCAYSLFCGKQLAVLNREIGGVCEVMMRYKQERLLVMLLIVRQTVHNLIGYSSDPLKLTGEAMNQDKLLNTALGASRDVVWSIHHHRIWLACFFGNYQLAEECVEAVRFVEKSPGYVTCSFVFLDGLISLVLSRKTKCPRRRKLGSTALQKVKNWATIVPCNFQHMAFLLEAEFAFLMDDERKGEKMYDAAIALAGQNGFTHEQALACERAATFYLDHGDKAKASRYYGRACDLYLEWGARAKVDQLREDKLSIIPDQTKHLH